MSWISTRVETGDSVSILGIRDILKRKQRHECKLEILCGRARNMAPINLAGKESIM